MVNFTHCFGKRGVSGANPLSKGRRERASANDASTFAFQSINNDKSEQGVKGNWSKKTIRERQRTDQPKREINQENP